MHLYSKRSYIDVKEAVYLVWCDPAVDVCGYCWRAGVWSVSGGAGRGRPTLRSAQADAQVFWAQVRSQATIFGDSAELGRPAQPGPLQHSFSLHSSPRQDGAETSVEQRPAGIQRSSQSLSCPCIYISRIQPAGEQDSWTWYRPIAVSK